MLLLGFSFSTDLLSVAGTPSVTRCLTDIGLVPLPAEALLCLGFNGCHSPYRSQHSRRAEGTGQGGGWEGLETPCYEKSGGNFSLGLPHQVTCGLLRHPCTPGWKLKPEGRIDTEVSEHTAAPESPI